MHRTITAHIAADPGRVFEIVSDLGTYNEWLELVTESVPAPGNGGDPGPAWITTIRAKVGPFARSKRLRMVRADQTDSMALFTRRETDGRHHSSWTMTSQVDEGPKGSVVTMDLRYDGALWTAPLEVILGTIAEDAGPRLEAYAGR